MAVDVTRDYLVTAYNAGVQIWDIRGALAENPRQISFRDGWMEHWMNFPHPGENDFFVDDVAAMQTGAQEVVVVTSGRDTVGFSAWLYTGSDFRQLYQDPLNSSEQVALSATWGRLWATASGVGGVHVYDVTEALGLDAPCTTAQSQCLGIYRGRIGSMLNGKYHGALVRDGEIFIAASDGTARPARPLALEIWKVDVGTPEASELHFSGLRSDTRGPQLFEVDGLAYLAIVHNQASQRTIRIYDAEACLTGPCSLGSAVWEMPLRTWSAPSDFLTFSVGAGRPYLYYGIEAHGLSGPKMEQLLDLSGLASGEVMEITSSGGSYQDPCNGSMVDYWGDYYSNNEHGLRNLQPRRMRCHPQKDTCYRAAYGILDVHVLLEAEPPTEELVFRDSFELGDASRWN